MDKVIESYFFEKKFYTEVTFLLLQTIFLQSAWFRYHNKDKKIKNLYFSAAGSHPSAGIPGVLSSAKVVENIIKSELK